MFIRSVTCIVLLVISQIGHAADRINVGIGDANDDIEDYRIGLQRDFSQHWWRDRAWGLSGYWELSLSHWQDGDSINTLALSPVFIYSPNRSSGLKPYIEGGIGVALISDQEIGACK